MSNDVSVSVVIPAYNAADSILGAVCSVLNQTAIDAVGEIIVINDGSADNTQQIIEAFMQTSDYLGVNKVRLINQENRGVSAARNIGIQASTGNWIAFLDSDDEWVKTKVEASLKAISNHPGIQALGSNNTVLQRRHGKKVANGLRRLNLNHVLWKSWPQTPTLMLSKRILCKTGGFNEEQSYAEDLDLLLRIVVQTPIYYLEDSLVKLANKPIYGASGLSANNQSMHQGCLLNIRSAKRRGDITGTVAILAMTWENVRYIRRLVITRLRSFV